MRHRPGRGDRLSAVLAVVVYNGSARWGAATALAELVGEGTRQLARTAPVERWFAGESYVLRHRTCAAKTREWSISQKASQWSDAGTLPAPDHKLARKKRSQFPLKIPSISPLK